MVMIETLCRVAEKLNTARVCWGVGGSFMLKQHGLVEKPNDLDLMLAVEDAEQADQLLCALGKKLESARKPCYSTRFFYEYQVDGVEIDLMAGFGIFHAAGHYEYLFDQTSIVERKVISGVEIPFTSLEDWYVLYQVMPNREPKVKLIEEYWISNGTQHPDLLIRALSGNLPENVLHRSRRWLDTQIQS
jgi:hypothetical protein